jgi:hypothetical protein
MFWPPGASGGETDRHLQHQGFLALITDALLITAQGLSAFLKDLYVSAPAMVMQTFEDQAAAIGKSTRYFALQASDQPSQHSSNN